MGNITLSGIFDKRDNLGFIIVNFPHLCSNIPTKFAYGVYISQLIRIGILFNILQTDIIS